MGFGLIIYLASIVGIDQSLYEAAEIDGANRFQRILSITLPGIRNTVKVMLMFSIMGLLSMFDQVYVMDNGLIHEEVDVVMTFIYSNGIRQMRLGYAAAAGTLVGIITLVITLVSKKFLKFGFEDV